ncbi:hypothetical protein CTI12_AA139950 [Artemisia annua]|uniref:Uncharacterized protein n=1 Tax=Artemisia annua TaxID=35608 RepID=A0A2U1PL78_ARTAN|nr:hypothetical protein CTI12_AA139950 [Artemisia annua]
METHRRSKTSPASDMFTFPEMSPDVKFGSELADQLFANGKLLHHHFPAEQNNFTIPKSLILSRTSSISSKGSLIARTSTSDMSPMRKLSLMTNQAKPLSAIKASSASGRFNDYGHSQRWQFIAPVPMLNRRNSSRKKKGTKRKVKRERVVRKGLCRRFFGWIVSTCQECHAIEPTKRVKFHFGLWSS